MATVFTHSIVGAATLYCAPQKYHSTRNYIIAAFLAACSDFDVITFRLGIPYDSLLGHRGLSHSLLIAIILGICGTFLASRTTPNEKTSFWGLAGIMSVAGLSHGILDAFTNGGHGVAFFSPFTTGRYFFPVTPIKVCSIGRNFSALKPLKFSKASFSLSFFPS